MAVTASAAAVKSVGIARLLRQRGAQVFVVVSKAARQFVSIPKLEEASGHEVACELVSKSDEQLLKKGRHREIKARHLQLAQQCAFFLVAPATANTLSKMACGITEDEQRSADLLLSMYLALPSSTPVGVAPAMHSNMWSHAATKKSVEILRQRRVLFFGPVSGRLASGDEGVGRMQEPAEIAAGVEHALAPAVLEGKKILVTAGPTREYLDPVRFLSNSSSGKMGFEIAREAALRGAKVAVVCGPVCGEVRSLALQGTQIVDVVSAQEMFSAAKKLFPTCDFFFSAAAVSDFRPASQSKTKIKKTSAGLRLGLVSTPDILAWCGENKKRGQIVVGFALETGNVEKNALGKMRRKNCDFIVANTAEAAGASKSEAIVFFKAGKTRLGKTDKALMAGKILSLVIEKS